MPSLVVQLAQPAAQLLAHLGVERAERLVEQQHARLDRQRAGERHALALAAGELRRIAARRSRSSCTRSSSSSTRSRDLRLGGRVAARPHAQAEGDVLEHASCGGTARSAGTRSRRGARARRADARPRRRTGPRPRSGNSSPAMMRSSVVLPEPDGPSSAHELARRGSSRLDAVERGEAVEALGDADLDRRHDGLLGRPARAAQRARRAPFEQRS